MKEIFSKHDSVQTYTKNLSINSILDESKLQLLYCPFSFRLFSKRERKHRKDTNNVVQNVADLNASFTCY